MFTAFILLLFLFLEYSFIPAAFPWLFWPLSLLLGPSLSARDPWTGVWWFAAWGLLAWLVGTPSLSYSSAHLLAAPLSYVLSTTILAKRSLWSQTFGAALVSLIVLPFIVPYDQGYLIAIQSLVLGYVLTVIGAFVYTKLANWRRRFFVVR